MSPDQFWDLTWHDWGLYLFRFKQDQEERKLEEELKWAPWRELYALMCNIHRDPKKTPTPFKGTDFVKLSFDENQQPIQITIPDDDFLERIKKKYSKK